MGSWQSLAAEEYGYAMLEVNSSNTIIKFLNSEGKAVDDRLLVAVIGLFRLLDIQHASAYNPRSGTWRSQWWCLELFGWYINIQQGKKKVLSTGGSRPEFPHIPSVFWHSKTLAMGKVFGWVWCNLSGLLYSWSRSLFLQVLWDEMKLANPNAQQAGRAWGMIRWRLSCVIATQLYGDYNKPL